MKTQKQLDRYVDDRVMCERHEHDPLDYGLAYSAQDYLRDYEEDDGESIDEDKQKFLVEANDEDHNTVREKYLNYPLPIPRATPGSQKLVHHQKPVIKSQLGINMGNQLMTPTKYLRLQSANRQYSGPQNFSQKFYVQRASHQLQMRHDQKSGAGRVVKSALGQHKNLEPLLRNYSEQIGVSKHKANINIKKCYDTPSSPARFQELITIVKQKREQLEAKKERWASVLIKPCFLKYKHEYEPIIIEEAFFKKNDKAQMVEKNFSHSQQQVRAQTADQKSINFDRINSGKKGIHLFVFVHGFQASSFDMRAMKNYVCLTLPKVLCLCSSANEDLTEGSIDRMGVNLAREVTKYISDWCYSKDGQTLYLNKLSFVGHSLGGLIIRSALPNLEKFKGYFYGYMSMGSPHLGYMYNSNSLVQAGIWFLKNWKQSQCLQQLSMTDSQDKSHSYLFKLSKTPGLSWFKHIIFCSSHQDSYAPYDSARVQLCSRAVDADNSQGNGVYISMAKSILGQLAQCQSIVRLDVDFKIAESNIDALIGRTAHILLVECEPLLEMLVNRYTEFFCE